jgi:hypothetical protein
MKSIDELKSEDKVLDEHSIEILSRALMPRIVDTIFLQLHAILECYPDAQQAIRKVIFPQED